MAGQEADFVERFGRAALGDAHVVQRYLLSDEANGVSLRRSVSAARENARSIREVVSQEVWQVINELHVFLESDEAEALMTHDLDALYARVQRATQLGLGLLRSTMLHDAPLDYIWLGVLLERASASRRGCSTSSTTRSSPRVRHTPSSRRPCGCRCCARAPASRRS